MDLSQSSALGDLHQALSDLCGPEWALRIKATYGASPTDVVGVDVHFSRPAPNQDEIPEADRSGSAVRLLKTKEVAEYLRVCERTVQTLVAEGELTPIKVRTQTRFAPDNVEAYVRSQARSRGGRRR